MLSKTKELKFIAVNLLNTCLSMIKSDYIEYSEEITNKLNLKKMNLRVSFLINEIMVGRLNDDDIIYAYIENILSIFMDDEIDVFEVLERAIIKYNKITLR